MATNTVIVLKHIGITVPSSSLPLVHEVAHSLHYEIDRADKGAFSQRWFERYRRNKSVDSVNNHYRPAALEWHQLKLRQLIECGSIDSYAEFDTSIDTPLRVTTSGEKKEYIAKDGLTLFYDKQEVAASPELLLGTLLRDRKNLPEKMAETLSRVIFDPTASTEHFRHPAEDVSSGYDRIREDIATHTENFTRAALFPSSNRRELARIRTEPKLKSKVDDLAETGFIKPEVANYLLDPSAPLDASYGAGWAVGTVFPPFIGIVPFQLPADLAESAKVVTIVNLAKGRVMAKLTLGSLEMFSGTSYPRASALAQDLAYFIGSRSDLGVHYFLVGPSACSDKNKESVWLYDPAIKTTRDLANLEQRIHQQYLSR